MIKKSAVKVGDKVVGNKNIGEGFYSDPRGKVGEITKINSYVWVRFEGSPVEEPMIVAELDPYVEKSTEEFYTVEELREQVKAIQELIELYPKGIRLVKE